MSRRTKIAAALVFLGILHGLVIFAGFLAPYPYAEQHREFPYAPPTPIHWSRLQFWSTGACLACGSRASSSCSAPMLTAGTCSRACYTAGGCRCSRGCWRRSCLSAWAWRWGRRRASTADGWIDSSCAAGELVMALPWLYLLLAVRAFLPLHITTVQAFFLIVVIIGGVGWVRPARLIRGVVLSARERGFVLAARGFGASDAYLIRRHILPLTLGVVLTQATVLDPAVHSGGGRTLVPGLGSGRTGAELGQHAGGGPAVSRPGGTWVDAGAGIGHHPGFAGLSAARRHPHGPGGPSTTSGTTAPTTAPMISAELPAPRKETSRPASEPMPAPTTAIMRRFATILFLHRAG